MNSFDMCQFDPRFQPRVTYRKQSERRLEFSTSMQIESRKGRRQTERYVPTVAYSENALRKIVTAKTWSYIYGHGLGLKGVVATLPEGIGWRELEAKSLERFWKSRWSPEHVYAVLKCGSPAELFARIFWLSWRQNYNSREVGKAVGMSPGAVRVVLYRGSEIARKLGIEMPSAHWTKDTKRRPSQEDPH